MSAHALVMDLKELELKRKKDFEYFDEKLNAAQAKNEDLEKENTKLLMELNRFKDEAETRRVTMQSLQAQLFESQEELKIAKSNADYIEILRKENFRLKQQMLVCRDRLQKMEEKNEANIDEKTQSWSKFQAQYKLLEKSALHELKKVKSLYDELKKETTALSAYNDELNERLKNKALQLAEYKQLLESAQKSYQSKIQVLEQNISALNKVNHKLMELKSSKEEKAATPTASTTASVESAGTATVSVNPV